MRCKYCQTENADGSEVCVGCGRELTGSASRRDIETMSEIPNKSPSPDNSQDESWPGFTSWGAAANPDQGDTIIRPSAADTEEDQRENAFDEIARIIGEHYEILRQLGVGGMGVTYLARDTNLDREVAIKRLRAPDSSARTAIKRFLIEARAIAALNHRNIVTIYELGKDALGPFIVMEYLSGGDVHTLLRRSGPFELSKALEIINAVGRALAYAHHKNIIHRDVKPSNIMLTEDGPAKLVDFGLAKTPSAAEVSATGLAMGTASYMAPEQRRDAKHADHRSDIYALAKTLYHMVTGQVPDAVDLDALPEEIRPAVKQALKPRPEDRPFSVREFLAGLRPIGANTATFMQTNTFMGGPATMAASTACPNCGQINHPDSRFCENCGTGLFSKCPRCNSEYRIIARYCSNCGLDTIRYDQALTFLTNAHRHYDDCQYDQAIEQVEAGLKTGQLQDKLSEVRQAAEEAKKRIVVLRAESVKFIDRRQYAKAESALREAIELVGEDEELSAMLGEVARKNLALQVSALRGEAERLMEEEEFEQAQEKLQSAIDLNGEMPEIADTLKMIPARIRDRDIRRLCAEADALAGEQEYAKAVETLRKACQLDTGREATRNLLAEAEYRLQQHELDTLLAQAGRSAREG
ncbi:MAG: protein kinase, partial [Planctomycetes bacterium]|nr:protein kinase [Planctomycetota bacterium]